MLCNEIVSLDESGEAASLRPAIRFAGKVYVGRAGEVHLQLYGRLPDGGIATVLRDPNSVGFVTEKGRYLTRADAFGYARDNDLINASRSIGDSGELTAEMLRSWVPLGNSFGRRYRD